MTDRFLVRTEGGPLDAGTCPPSTRGRNTTTMTTLTVGDSDHASLCRLASQVVAGPSLGDREGTWTGRAKQLAQIMVTVLDENLLALAADLVISTQFGSVPMLQRKLYLGYARAALLMGELEAAGIVAPQDGASARVVLVRLAGKDAAIAALRASGAREGSHP